MNKISPIPLIIDHLKTLKNYGTGKASISDYMTFFALPILLGLILSRTNLAFDPNSINLVLTSASIFAALFLNLIMLIYNLVSSKSKDPAFTSIKKQIMLELNANISFSVLICILIIICCLASIICAAISKSHAFVFLLSSLVVMLILHFFMILKRIHMLLMDQ